MSPTPTTITTRAKAGALSTPTTRTQSTKANIEKYIDSKLKVIAEKITEQITAGIHKIVAEEIDSMALTLKEHFKEQLSNVYAEITHLKKTYATEMCHLKSQIALLHTKVSKQENAAVAADLRIHGIPIVQTENLLDIFKELCSVLKTSPPPVVNIRRLPANRKSTSASDPDIIIQLGSPQDKNNFLRTAAKHIRDTGNPLRLRDLGFDSDQPFYINEQLTAANHKILKHAIRFKRQEQLFSVFTRRGLTHVKISDKSNVISIQSIEQLNLLVNTEINNATINLDPGFRGFDVENEN